MRPDQYVYAAVLILVLCAVGYFLLPVYAEYKEARKEREKLEEQLIKLDWQYQQVEQNIYALQNDPRAVERVAREKFGWCRQDEKIYHFDPPPPFVGADRTEHLP